MQITRRRAALAAAAGLAGGAAKAAPASTGPGYGLISQILSAPGKRDELIRVLLTGAMGMPGCLSYVVARDSSQDDAIWVTELWRDKAAHSASLALPAVQAAIGTARPLISGFRAHAETVPVGGYGVPGA